MPSPRMSRSVFLPTLLTLLTLALTGQAAVAGPPPAEPAMDLLDSRYLLHLYRGDGLVIPLASEGMRKYSLEYKNPWGNVETGDGHSGRALKSRAAELRFPWHKGSEAAVVRVRVKGLAARQRISVNVNGKPLRTVDLQPGWQVITMDAPAGRLHAGENTMLLTLAQKGASRSGPAYGLFHSIDIAPAPASTPVPDAPWPPVTPAGAFNAGGRNRPALVGFSSLAEYLEVPEHATFEVGTAAGSPARFRIVLRLADGSTALLLDEKQGPGSWQERRINLAPHAGKLGRLELDLADVDPAQAAWTEPRITLSPVARRAETRTYTNAILFVVDALRADRIPLYRDTRVQTPRIVAAARQGGIVFLNNQAASPSSPPSHASIQTGLIPRAHGVGGDTGKLNAGVSPVSALLGKAGIATGYFGNNPFGMKRLRAASNWTEFHQPAMEGKSNDCKVVVKDLLAFAQKQAAAKKRFFVSALPMEPHTPYIVHDGITDRYFKGPYDPEVGKSIDGRLFDKIVHGSVVMNDARWAQLKGMYDGEVEYLDGCFGQLLDGLKAAGLDQNTAVLLASDHGEGMFEHKKLGHAYGMQAELTDVPLVLFAPGLVKGLVRVPTVTSHIDIVPTIMELLGVPLHDKLQGAPLQQLALRDGPWTPRVMPIEYGRSYALRSQWFKYAVDYGGQESLFDLRADPTEQKDLKPTQHTALRYFRDLTGFYLAHRGEWRVRIWGTLNNHSKAFVEAMGPAS